MIRHDAAEQLHTVAAVGPVLQTGVRVERPVDADVDDHRAYVWCGPARLTFDTIEQVETFANLLLDRLADLQFSEAIRAVVGTFTPETVPTSPEIGEALTVHHIVEHAAQTHLQFTGEPMPTEALDRVVTAVRQFVADGIAE